ncbi:MAG: hypothetical protein WD073_08065 [Xanthobacteraceae bacterium]
MTYLLAALISLFVGWTAAASDVLFRDENRPGVFAGTTGTLLLLALTAAAGISAAGDIVWIFRAIPSSAVIVIIAGGGWLGFAASNKLHVNAAGAINRLIVGVAGLALLYGIAWSLLPPPPVVDF